MGAETDCGDWCILDRDGARITILINIRLGDTVAQDAGELPRGVGAAAQGVIIPAQSGGSVLDRKSVV